MHDLSNYAGQINAEHDQATEKAREAIQHAIRCGEFLLEVKDILDHGVFLPWIRENCIFAERTAQRYMKLASKSAAVSHLPSIRAALAALEGEKIPKNESESVVLDLAPPPGCGRLGLMSDKSELWIIPSTSLDFYFITLVTPDDDDDFGDCGCLVEGTRRPVPCELLSDTLNVLCKSYLVESIQWSEFETSASEKNIWLTGKTAT